MDSESSIDHETLYDDDDGRPSGRRWYDSYTRKPEWISYGLLALLYVLILALFITVYSGDNISSTRKHLVTLKEMNAFRERGQTCEQGWKQADDSCYFLTVVKATWPKTRGTCLKKGADLAVITNEREQIFLATLTGASSYKRYWIGLHDMDEEGTWMWLDGTHYETSYKHWTEGEPNDMNDEDCALLWTSGEWNDVPCEYEDSYGICEKKL